MLRHWSSVILPSALLLAILLAALLFSDFALSGVAPQWVRFVAREVQAACRDPGTQWMVVLCLVFYLVTFIFLENRRGPSTPHPIPLPDRSGEGGALARFAQFCGRNPDVWLAALVILILLRYALDYENAARSLSVVVLLTGMVLGKGIALWAAWPRSQEVPGSSDADWFAAKANALLWILVLLLAAASLWQPERGMEFFYRGQQRWTGPWDNPNLYGLLMGVGVVLAGGLGVTSCQLKVAGGSTGRLWLFRVLAFVGMVCCAYGLLRSYSRGAWLGTACGLGFLTWRFFNRELPEPHENQQGVGGNPHSCLWRISRFKSDWLPISILLISTLVLCFWQFRHTEHPLLRRVFSVGNVNDFSWRNRVTAWQGAGRMMWDRPLHGFGWNQAEQVYGMDYRAARLDETAAIQMNDYLMLGISAGGPALGCLLAYLWCALRRGATFNLQAPATATAGAGVLMVGFWFDGGLFKLATGAVFWALIELARIDNRSSAPSVTSRRGRGLILNPPGRASLTPIESNRMLRWLAGTGAALALGLTTLHLVTPQLRVTPRTLMVARHVLVPPAEREDFEYLAAQGIWSGRPLRVLLQHAHLANYNRGLVNWKLDDATYRQFVLSPEISPDHDGDLRWRRPLWEFFYPRLRREQNVVSAAETVGRQLRERVTVAPAGETPRPILDCWRSQSADERGFAVLRVAALRASGIPARLDENFQLEFFNGDGWRSVTP